MAKQKQTTSEGDQATAGGNGNAVGALKPRSAALAASGVRTAGDFANLMSALMSDLLDGRVTPNIGNATCNAGGKLLKVVEMQCKYGTQGPGGGTRTLILAALDDDPDAASSAAAG